MASIDQLPSHQSLLPSLPPPLPTTPPPPLPRALSHEHVPVDSSVSMISGDDTPVCSMNGRDRRGSTGPPPPPRPDRSVLRRSLVGKLPVHSIATTTTSPSKEVTAAPATAPTPTPTPTATATTTSDDAMSAELASLAAAAASRAAVAAAAAAAMADCVSSINTVIPTPTASSAAQLTLATPTSNSAMTPTALTSRSDDSTISFHDIMNDIADAKRSGIGTITSPLSVRSLGIGEADDILAPLPGTTAIEALVLLKQSTITTTTTTTTTITSTVTSPTWQEEKEQLQVQQVQQQQQHQQQQGEADPMSPPIENPTQHLTLDDLPHQTHTASIHARTGSTLETPDTYRMSLPLILPPTRQRGATWHASSSAVTPAATVMPPPLPSNPPNAKLAQRALAAVNAVHAQSAPAPTTTTSSSIVGEMDDTDPGAPVTTSTASTPTTSSTSSTSLTSSTSSTSTGSPAPTIPSLSAKRKPPPLPPVVSAANSANSAPSITAPSNTSNTSNSSNDMTVSVNAAVVAGRGKTPPGSPLIGAARPDKAAVQRLLGLTATLDQLSSTPASTTATVGPAPKSSAAAPTDDNDEWSTEALDRTAGRTRSQTYAPSSSTSLSRGGMTNGTANDTSVNSITGGNTSNGSGAARPPRPQLPAHVRAVLGGGAATTTSASPVTTSPPTPVASLMAPPTATIPVVALPAAATTAAAATAIPVTPAVDKLHVTPLLYTNTNINATTTNGIDSSSNSNGNHSKLMNGPTTPSPNGSDADTYRNWTPSSFALGSTTNTPRIASTSHGTSPVQTPVAASASASSTTPSSKVPSTKTTSPGSTPSRISHNSTNTSGLPTHHRRRSSGGAATNGSNSNGNNGVIKAAPSRPQPLPPPLEVGSAAWKQYYAIN